MIKKRRKTIEAESESIPRKVLKTVAEPVEPTRHSECNLTRATKSLRISSGSDSKSRSSYELKGLPSDASKFTEEDIMAFNAIFKPADENKDIMPDVEAKNFPCQYLLPEIDRNALEKKSFNIRNLNTTDKYVKQFFWTLNKVVMNSGVDIGMAESKTDSLVNHLLTRALDFDGWPFGVRIKENYKLNINDKNVFANPDFIVDMDGITILVTENKQLKNVSFPDYGEAQILAEILACGWANLDQSGKYIDQTIYAIRVISSYITFYKAKIPKAYWKELKRGLPQKQSIEILRWPGENTKESGLDLAEAKDRNIIFEAITKLREYFLSSDSSTNTSTTASSSTTSITAPAEQSSKSEGKKPLK